MENLSYEALYRGVLDEPPQTSEAFIKAIRRDVVSRNIQTLIAQNSTFSDEEKMLFSMRELTNLFCNEISYRMWRAQCDHRLYREQPFVYQSRACDYLPGIIDTTEETVLIQGIIDAFFVEEGHVVLLDYKTDFVSSADELWKRYEIQLNAYEEAIKRLTGLPVAEKIIYSFYLGSLCKPL
jgi:ATP-dependent helicase/nuclease subunit A